MQLYVVCIMYSRYCYFVISMTVVFTLMCHQSRSMEKLSMKSLELKDTGNEMESCNTCVGITPAWARGTATRGTHTRERYMPHYSSTSARVLVGTLRIVVVFSLATSISQSLQMVLG